MEKVFDVPDGLPQSYPFVPHSGMPNSTKGNVTNISRRQVFNYLYTVTSGGILVIAEDGRPGRPKDLPEGMAADKDTKAFLVVSNYSDINPTRYPKDGRLDQYGAGLSFGKVNVEAPNRETREGEMALLCDTGCGPEKVWRFLLATALHLEARNPIIDPDQARPTEDDSRVLDLIDEVLGGE